MVTLKYIDRLKRMDQLIRQQHTGNSDEFAERMGISRRQLYNLIEELKDFGLPVSFSRRAQTFFYAHNCRLEINIQVKDLDKQDYYVYEGGHVKKTFLNLYSNGVATIYVQSLY